VGGVDGPAVQAAGKMGDWNQARDGAIGAHTDAGGQCTDADIGADGRNAYYSWRPWVGEN